MLAGAEVDARTDVGVQQAQREGGTTQEHRRKEGRGVSTKRKVHERGETALQLVIRRRQGDVIFCSPPPTRGV